MKKVLSLSILICLFCLDSSVLAQGGEPLEHYVKGENLAKRGQFDEAVGEYERALASSKTQTDFHYKFYYGIAMCRYKQKNVSATIEALDNSITSKNDFVPSYVLRSRMYKLKKQYGKMVSDLDAAFKYEKDVEKKVGYKMTAMSYFKNTRNWEEAYKQMSDARSVAKDNLSVNYYFAKLANELGKYKEAEQAINDIKSNITQMNDSDAAKYHYELGYSLFNQKRFKDASVAFDLAKKNRAFIAKVRKFSPDYFCNIATSYLRVYEYAKCEEYVDKALMIQESFAFAYVLRSQASKKGTDREQELAPLKQAVEHENDYIRKVKLYDQISDIQLQAGDYENCLKTIEESLKIKNDDPDALFQKSVALYKMGQFEQAVASCEDLMKKSSSGKVQADLYFLIGLAAKKGSDFEKANRAFYRAFQSSHKFAAEIEAEEVNNELQRIKTEQQKKKEKEDAAAGN